MTSQSFHSKLTSTGGQQVSPSKTMGTQKKILYEAITPLSLASPTDTRSKGCGREEPGGRWGKGGLASSLLYAASDLIEMEILGLKTPWASLRQEKGHWRTFKSSFPCKTNQRVETFLCHIMESQVSTLQKNRWFCIWKQSLGINSIINI